MLVMVLNLHNFRELDIRSELNDQHKLLKTIQVRVHDFYVFIFILVT